MAHPQKLHERHARRRHHIRQREAPGTSKKRGSVAAGGKRRASSRHCQALPRDARLALGLRLCHWGVAATDPQADGVVSPGGIGYDINCGVRLIRTNLDIKQLEGKQKHLWAICLRMFPAALALAGKIRLTVQEERTMLEKGRTVGQLSVNTGIHATSSLQKPPDFCNARTLTLQASAL